MIETESGAQQKTHNDLVLSFLSVRRAIGVLGYFLPLVLAAYGLLTGGILPSMSAYFYSPMREVFVGTLCAQAVFLWSYEGYREPGRMLTDRFVARIAAIAAALIALAPTSPQAKADPATALDYPCTLLQCILHDGPSSVLHILAVVTFFGALTVYCFVLFMRGGDDTPRKRAARRIYRLCGWLIVISIAAIGLLSLTGLGDTLAALHPVFWLELVACFAFATSWLVKGDALIPVVRMMER